MSKGCLPGATSLLGRSWKQKTGKGGMTTLTRNAAWGLMKGTARMLVGVDVVHQDEVKPHN